MTITVYTFERGGYEYGSFTTQSYQEAREYARANRCRIIANEFEWSDSEPLDDFQTRADQREERRVKSGG